MDWTDRRFTSCVPESAPMVACPREQGGRLARHWLLAGTLVLGAAALAPGAAAQSLSDTYVAVGLASDKVVRGLSQTDGQPSAMLDLGWRSARGWSLSAGAATLHDRRALEGTLGLAWQHQVDARWQLQAGTTRYLYRATHQRYRPYTEFYVTADWDGRLTLLLAASPDARFERADGSARRTPSVHGELTWHQRLAGPLALDLGAGHIVFDGLPGYTYGSAGLGWSGGPLQWFLTRVDSNATARSSLPADVAGSRWIVAVSRTF